MKTILSTKKLTSPQKEFFLNGGLDLVEYDAISIEYHTATIKEDGYLIFTSQNAVKAYLKVSKNYIGRAAFCVGEKTQTLLMKNDVLVMAMKENAFELAEHIVQIYNNETFTYFTGNLRRNELVELFIKNNIRYKEVQVYTTHLNIKKFDQGFDGVLFFSPSGIKSFLDENILGNAMAFCIGHTTAAEIKKYTDNYIVVTKPTVENVLVQTINHFKKYD